MITNLSIKAVLATAILTMSFSAPVLAATPVGTDMDTGSTIYSVTEAEYDSLVAAIDIQNKQEQPEYLATYAGINFYRIPQKKLRKQTLPGGSIQIWYKNTEKITMYDTNGIIVTNPDGTSENGTVSAYTNVKGLTSKDAETTGAAFLNDAYGLYSQTYLLTSAMARHPVFCKTDESGYGTIYFSAAGMYDLFVQEPLQEQSVLPAVKNCVKNGMTKDQVIDALITYIADTITYDYGTGAWPVAHPGTSLKDGAGICQDYAGAFSFLARLVPFNANGTVDWTNGASNVLKPQWACTDTHAFNLLTYDGRVRWIDICWYDIRGDIRWLDMGSAELSEPSHTNVIAMYF